MPTTKSVAKNIRVAERKRLRSKPVRSLVKTNITKAEKLIESNETEAARAAALTAVRSLDKAAEKGILHPRNAARRKSRLMRKLNKLVAVAAAPAKAEAEAKAKPAPKKKTTRKPRATKKAA